MKVLQQDSAAWWLADRFKDRFPEGPFPILLAHIKKLISCQSARYNNIKRLINAYEKGVRQQNRDMIDDEELVDKKLSFNHARNAVDTVHTKICKSRVLPMALTMGGGALQRQRAIEMEKALHGELRKNDIDLLFEQVSLDSLVATIGWVHVLHGRPSLTIDWVPAEDVVIDPAETRAKKPRSIYRRLLIDRYVLLEIYGKNDDAFFGTAKNRKAKIRKAKAAGDSAWGTRDELANLVEVWVAYHQRSDDDSDPEVDHDGRYAVIIDGCTLEFVPWDRPMLPFVAYVSAPRMRQLHGLSLMADFLPIQEEHDKISQRIQRSAHRMGGTHILAPREANINSRELNNEQGSVVEYDVSAGGPGAVTELNPSIANPQTFEYRRELIQEMYMSRGIPSLAATGQLPPGMSGASGKALQVAEEGIDERLLIPNNQKHRFLLSLSWLVIEEARAMVEDNPSYSVKAKDERRALKKVEWKSVLMDHEEFDLDIFPINALAKSPAARFAQLTELLKVSAISVEQFRRLFGLPDLEAENEVDLSDIDIIDRVMDQIVIEGTPIQPEYFDYLELILQRGRKFYNLCRKKKVPEERLALLRDYLLRAKEMNDEQIAKATATLQGGMAPPGQPGAPQPSLGVAQPMPQPLPQQQAAA